MTDRLAAGCSRRTGRVRATEIALALLLAHWVFAAQATAADQPLASLVPDDVGLSIEVTDLATHLEAFRQTEIYRRLTHFRPVQQFLAENGAALSTLADEVQQQTGLSPEDLLRKLLGRRVLIAVWPGSTDAGAPPGPALMVAECTDAQVLATVMEKLLAAEHAAGRRVERQAWQRGELACAIHRIEPGTDQPPLFVANLDRLGIVATDARAVASVLEFHAGQNAAQSLANRAEYAAGMARLNPEALVRAFVNPRAWDALLAAHIATSGKSSDQAGHWLIERLRQADYLVASCQLGRQIVIEGFLETKGATATGADELSPQPAEHADLAGRLPAGALVALAGRVDLRMLLARFFSERGLSAQPATGAAADEVNAGHEALTALIGEQGYDAVAALIARPATAAGAKTTTDWIVGFDTNALLPDDRLALARRLDPILRGALTAAVMLYNRQGQTMSIESAEEEGVPLTSVEGLALLGKGDAATFSLLKGFFWAGTSRLIVRDAAQLDAERSLAADPRFKELANPRIARRTHLAYLDLAGLGSLIAGPAEAAAAEGDRPARGPQSRDLVELLSLADRLLVEIQIDRHVLAISAVVTADSDSQ